MKQRKLSIESKDRGVIDAREDKFLLHPTDLRSAFEIARTIAILQNVETKVVEEDPIRHTLMKVDVCGNVQTIRTTIANMAKKLNIPCKFGKTWKTVE